MDIYGGVHDATRCAACGTALPPDITLGGFQAYGKMYFHCLNHGVRARAAVEERVRIEKYEGVE